MRHLLHTYQSVNELVQHVEANSDPRGQSHSNHDPEFYGNCTFAQAIDRARQGWSEPRPKIDAILNPVREKLATKLDNIQVRVHDMFGYEPDIDRFVAGELECMWNDMPIEEPTTGRVFTLLLSTSVLGGVRAETVFKRGAAVIALVEAFQMLNCDVTVWVENSCTSTGTGARGDVYTVLTKVHTAGDPLDINNVMFPLGHPAWQRRIVFGHREANPQVLRERWGFTPGHGMGSTTEPMCDEIVDASIVLAQDPRGSDLMLTDPTQWVLDQIEAQGVYSPELGDE